MSAEAGSGVRRDGVGAALADAMKAAVLSSPRIRLRLYRLARSMVTGVGLLLLSMLAMNAWLISTTQTRIHDHIDRLADYDVALVLGTSPYTHSGAPNLLFKHRMLAAARLYADGKVNHLLVSGANPGYYNEPQEMYQALRRLGVPHAAMTLDFAGYSTFDSIVRSRRIFGLDRYIVVSQRYHDYRALFIAAQSGIDASAYVLPQEDLRQSFLPELREYFARVKAVLDLYAWQARPRYLGPRVPMTLDDAHESAALACWRDGYDPGQSMFAWRHYRNNRTSAGISGKQTVE